MGGEEDIVKRKVTVPKPFKITQQKPKKEKEEEAPPPKFIPTPAPPGMYNNSLANVDKKNQKRKNKATKV